MKETKKDNLIEEMKKQNLNLREWATLEEAADKCRYSKPQINKLAEKGNERIGTIKISNTVLYNLKDILQYEANHQKRPILSPVWDELTFLPGEHFYPLIGYDLKYFISNKNRVIDATNGRVLTPHPHKNVEGKLTGYSCVTLMKDGKNKTEKIHRLVGKTQCPNVFNYNIFHHISKAKHNGLYDDRASNILPVINMDVHDELHKLMDKDKKAYKEMIAKMKKSNKQKIFKIPDLDFASDEHFNYYMMVNKVGYKEYQKSGTVPLNCILQQRAEVK